MALVVAAVAIFNVRHRDPHTVSAVVVVRHCPRAPRPTVAGPTTTIACPDTVGQEGGPGGPTGARGETGSKGLGDTGSFWDETIEGGRPELLRPGVVCAEVVSLPVRHL